MEPRKRGRFSFKLFVVFVVIFNITEINATAICHQGCPAGSAKGGKYNYKANALYNYNVDSSITVYLSGADAQETTLHVQGPVQLYSEGDCMYTLRIPQMFTFGPDKKKIKLSDDLQIQKPIRFSMSGNDEITPEICTDSNDSEFGLNIKRAIISMIQSSAATTSSSSSSSSSSASDTGRKSYEIDVFGTCPTTSTETRTGDTTIVTKIRNLNLCGYRETIANGLVTSIINEQSGIKSTPLLNGDYTCEQRIKGGVLQSAQLNEEYTYVPFTNGEAGVRTKIVTKLTIKGKPVDAANVIKVNAQRPRSIIFDDPEQIPSADNMKDVIIKALRNTIDTYQNNVGPKAATQFSELIRLMRYAKDGDLAAIYNQIKSGTIQHKSNKALTRKIFLDALFRTGTGYSVQFCASLLKSQEITDEREKRFAYLSFNLVDSMTKEALQSVNKLFDGNPPKEAYLSIGNLVNKYCRKNGCESAEIKSISENFVKRLQNCKSDNKIQENQIVAVLKGLRNTNNLVNPALDKVVQCTNEKLPARIRVSAIQAFTANACDKKIQTTAWNLLKNRAEDSEIRIEAYLVLTKCPNAALATDLKALLDDETVHQVGSFIQTHLASLRASTDPYRENLRKHFGQIRSTQSFPNDFRRYSFNRELSYQFNSLGIGASLDSNVIYSQSDFLPKSTYLNVTAELFGNNFNIFELAARQENLNTLLEHNFGPKGLYNTHSLNGFLQSIFDNYRTIIDDIEQRKQQLLNTVGQTRRSRRSTRDDIKQYQRLVKLGNEIHDDIDLDLSIKLFGSEMLFLSLGDDIPINSQEFLSKFNECMSKMIQNAKGFDHTYEAHTLFMDGKLVYPTGIGLPLKLLSEGAAVMRTEISGKIDIRSIISDPSNMQINLKIVPSYNIEVTGKLIVDGWAVSTGLQVSGSVHTSTGADVFVKLLDGQGVDIKIKSPLKKQEIFSFDHRIVFVTQERGRETVQQNLKFSSQKKEFSDCFDQLYKNIGVTFCGDVSITVPGNAGVASFPLNGPNKASLALEVDSEYNFKAIYDNSNARHQKLTFEFDTPKSEGNNRHTELVFEAAIEPSLFVRTTFTAPYAKIGAEAGFINTPKEISAYAQANNGGDQYLIKLGFNKYGAPPQQEFSPIVIYQTPTRKDNSVFGYRVDGKIMVDSSKPPSVRYNFNDIKVIGVNDPDPFKMNGWVDFNKEKIATDIQLEKSFRKGTVVGSVTFRTEGINLDLAVKTNFHEMANGKIVYDSIRTDDHFKSDLTLVYGSDLDSSTKRIEILQDYDYVIVDKSIKSIKFKNKFKFGFLQSHIKVDGEYNRNLIKYDVEGGYAKHKIGSNLNAKLNGKTVGDYDIEFGLSINDHSVHLNADREIDNGKSKFSNKLRTSFGASFELNGVVGHRLTKQDADIIINGVFVFADKQDPYKFAFKLLMTPKDITSNGKLTIGAVTNELITYDLKAQRGDTTKGQFEVNVKDLLFGKGSFKVNVNTGQGDATGVLNLKRLQRKIKLDSDFKIATPTYNFKLDIFYDFEKDGSKKITIDTKNKIERTQFNSENSLDILTEKYVFNINGNLEGQFNDGITKGNFKLILPTQQQISGALERELRVDVGAQKTSGKIFVKLNDLMPNRKQRSITLTGNLDDADFRARLFNMWHKLEYVDFDGDNILISTSAKHLPVPDHHHYKMGAATIEITGKLLRDAININFNLPEYCEEHAVYQFQTNYGQQFNLNANGKYYLGGRSKPTTYDIKLNIDTAGGGGGRVPIKLIKFESDGRFMAPQTENGLYELYLNGLCTLNDKTVSVTTNGKGNGHHGTGHVKLQLPDIEPFSTDASYTYTATDSDGADDSTDGVDSRHAQCSVDIKYGRGKEIKFTGDLKTVGANDISLHSTMKSPYEQSRNIDFTFKTTKANDNIYNTNVQLMANEKRYALNSEVIISETNPKIDITISYPPSVDTKLYAGFDRLGDNKYKGRLSIENFGQFNFNGNGEISYQNVDNFYVKFDVDSQLLKLNKIHAEINSKQSGGGGGGKGIEFKASSAGKNILSGHAEYTVREEKGKTTIEGQGNVKLADKNRDASFKFVKNRYEEAVDKETGVFLIFTGTLGPKNIVAELKLTNRNFVVRTSVCEEREQCINFEIRSAFKEIGIEQVKHELLISVDLRKLGYSHEFGLKAETERIGFIINHNLDVHLQAQDKTKYQYNVYVNSKKSGIVLTLPSRTISVETVYELPADIFGNYEISCTSHMDKLRKPTNGVQLSFTGYIKRSGKMNIQNYGELSFKHPTIKPMKITINSEFNGDQQIASGQMVIDIFTETNMAIKVDGKYTNADKTGKGFNITSELTAHSDGLGFQYGFTGHAAMSIPRRQISIAASGISPTTDLRTGCYIFVSDEKLEILLTGFNEEILHINGAYDAIRHNGELHATIQFLGATPIVIDGKTTSLSAYQIKITRGTLLDAQIDVAVGKEAKLIVTGNGKELYMGRIKLNAQEFLTPDYKIQDDEIKTFIKVVQKEFRTETERARNEIMDRIKKVQGAMVMQFNKLKTCIPDFSKLQVEYKNEFDQLIQELMADKSIKEFVEMFQRVYTTIGKTIGEIVQVLMESLKKIYDIINDFTRKLLQIFNDDILPTLSETYNKISQIITKFYEDTFNIFVAFIERAIKALKSFEDDFIKVGKILSDIVKNVAKIVAKYGDILRKELSDLYRMLIDNIKSLPGYEEIKQKIIEYLSKIIAPENLVKILNEIRAALKDTVPTSEIYEFVQNLTTYIEMKVTKKDVNDLDSIKVICMSFLKALRSIFDLVYRQSSDHISILSATVGGSGGGGGSSAGPAASSSSASPSIFGGTGIFAPIPLSITAIKRIPFLTTIKFSPWNYLRNEKFFSIQDLLYTYRPAQFNPFQFLPPFPMFGQIIDGTTIFTIDGKYIQFADTSCSYILAQDFYNGNFSIVANIQMGKLKGVTMLDKGDAIEIQLNNNNLEIGSIQLNNKPAELPIHKNNIMGWRSYYDISLMTAYGAMIQCTIDLKLCNININGFYYGQIRGLLGNGNSEEFDDFTLPDDKITESNADFINAYKLPKACPSLTTSAAAPANSIPKNKYCKQLFGIDSSLRYCYLFVKSIIYRDVCDLTVQNIASETEQREKACHLAFAYTSKCRYENIPIEMPSECDKCSNNNKDYNIGDAFTVQSPQKKADIVFVVDTSADATAAEDTKHNNYLTDLITPLIIDLRLRLKTRDITDTQIAVIGYNNNKKYFNHYTVNGKLDIIFSGGKFKFEPVTGPDADGPLVSGLSDLDYVFKLSYATCKKLEADLGLSVDAIAFREALKYPFRADASKSMIAVRSDQFQHSPNPMRVIGATFGSEMAKSRGVTVHYIGPIPELSISSSKDPKAAKNIVGFNAKLALTIQDSNKKTNIGSSDLRRNLQYGSDLGIDIVQNGYGYAFSSTNLLAAKPGDRKKMITVIGTAIGDQMSRLEIYNDCKCKLRDGLYPIESCRADEVNYLAPIKKAAGRG